jgi:ABC-type multidrug transport system ATPase subunit
MKKTDHPTAFSSSENSSNSRFTISTNGLSKRFNREWIFRNITFEFQASYLYAITGPNGSGKSTLLQILSGMVPPTGGVVTYKEEGHTIPIESIYKHVSFAAPYMDLIEELTLEEHFSFHFKLRNVRQGLSYSDLLSKCQLTDSRDKLIGNFSSGMKQRVKLALAFYTESKVIFLDEPTTNLDASAISWYFEELKTIKGRSLIFLASNTPTEYPVDASIIKITDYKQK